MKSRTKSHTTSDQRMHLSNRTLGSGLLCALVALGASSQAQAQEATPHRARDCGSTLSPEQVELALWLQQNGFYELSAQPEFTFQIPVTVHVVRTTAGAGGLTSTEVDLSFQVLNAGFLTTGMQFYQAGSTIYIDDDNLYTGIDTSAEINILRSISVVPNTINLYYTLVLADEGGNLNGKSSFTTSVFQGIVIKESASGTSTTPHEFGHYFDLYHPHEDAFGSECPDGSNCDTAGDLLCDTPADPELDGNPYSPDFNVTSTCNYFGTETQCGQSYSPDTNNFMSYAPSSCRIQFTAGQQSRALATLINLRPELIQPPWPGIVWVDASAGAVQTGTFYNPFDNVSLGASATGVGGTMVLKGGTYLETPTITKKMVIDTFSSKAVIR